MYKSRSALQEMEEMPRCTEIKVTGMKFKKMLWLSPFQLQLCREDINLLFVGSTPERKICGGEKKQV